MQGMFTYKSGLEFESEMDGIKFSMDAKPPVGTKAGPTPKELVLAGICGCSGMDIVSLLKKHRQNFESFKIFADTELTSGYPSIFKEIHLTYEIVGQISKEKFLDSVKLSMTKYCGVSAMIAEASPILYKVKLNGEIIGAGEAKFE